MTDVVRQGKLAVERSETGSTVLLPAPKKQDTNRCPAFFILVIGHAESHRVFGFACEMRASRSQENAKAPKWLSLSRNLWRALVESSSPPPPTDKKEHFAPFCYFSPTEAAKNASKKIFSPPY
jgi:hypothetical protein